MGGELQRGGDGVWHRTALGISQAIFYRFDFVSVELFWETAIGLELVCNIDFIFSL